MQSETTGSSLYVPSTGIPFSPSPLDTYQNLGTASNLSHTLSLTPDTSYQTLTPIPQQTAVPQNPPSTQGDSLLGVRSYALYGTSNVGTQAVRVIRGTNGRNVINTTNIRLGPSDTIQVFALGGNDRITVNRRTTAYGDAGADVLTSAAGRGGNTLLGNAGSDRLYAGVSDRLDGGIGNDQLWAGLRDNRLTGGAGADRFWLADGTFPTRPNRIMDFNLSADRMVIRNLPGVRSFADISLSRSGRNTIVRAGGRAIAIVNNVAPGRLRARHFLISNTLTPLPAPAINLGLASDTGAFANDGITSNATIAGQVSGQNVTRFEASLDNLSFVDLTSRLGIGGQFTLDSTTLGSLGGGTLGNGAHTLQVRATNSENTSTLQSFTFTLDTLAPSAPTLTSSAVTASGDALYTFTLTYTDNQAIDVASLGAGDVRVTGPGNFSQTATLVNVTPNANGSPRTATYQISTPGGSWDLADNGNYAIELLASQVQDVAGNSIAATGLGSFAVAIPLNLNIELTDDTGASDTDRITANGGITGSIVGNGFSTLEISVNNGNFTNITNRVTNGNYALTEADLAALGTLLAGSNTLRLRATNTENVSTVREFTFTLDDQNPAAPVVALTSDTGNSASDRITQNGALTLTGTETDALIEYSINGGATWTTSFTAVAGPNTVQVRQTDLAGNVSGVGSLTFTLDTQAPSTPGLTLTSDTGSSNSDRITQNSALNLTGLEGGTVVEYSLDGGTTWTTSYTPAAGPNTVQVRQRDTAGNISGIGSLTFTFDNQAPVAPTVALTSDTGSSNSDRVTQNGAITLTGLENGTLVEYSTNGGASWTNSFTAVAGANAVQVRQTDAAGNVSGVGSLTFTLDTQVPTIQTTTAAAVTTAGGTNYSFTLTYADNQNIDISTLGTGDVLVTGPGGFNVTATFVSVNLGTNGTPRTVTYQITPPGGDWSPVDSGNYTITLAANQVRDLAGNAIAAGTAATFNVNIPFTTQRINFQPVAAATPNGYTVDSGLGFDAARGYGWVAQGSSTPLDITARVFDRNAAPLNGVSVDQRLDTVALMQSGGAAAAWEYTLENGRYSVTVSVGDTAGGSNHLIQAEGQTVVPTFNATTTGGIQTFKLGTLTVDVTDGRLTLDAIGGTDTRINFVEIVPITPGDHPRVLSSPLANATNVNRRAAINLSDLSLVAAGEGVNGATLNATNIQLYRTRDGAAVNSNYNTSGGADTIIVQPVNVLDPNTQYTLRISSGVQDLGGRSFLPYSLTFTTGNELTPPTDGVSFSQSVVYSGGALGSLITSPDNRFLYATGLDGRIRRWQMQDDGSLTGEQVFTGLLPPTGRGPELIGIAFDPTNPNVLWVTQNTPSGGATEDFTSKVVRLTLTGGDAAFTATVQDYVVGLPRSGRDHFSNSLRFGPDNRLYLTQGSNTSAGVEDLPWGLRPERLLTAAMLQIDTTLTPPAGGFNVQTQNYTTANGTVIPGNYDPFAPNAPVKIYATGMRNSYDFVFHSNGTLYAPINGSGGGGITPDNPNTVANENLTNVGSRPDYIYRIVQGGYYGHPNPTRGEYIMAGGNPTAGVDAEELVGPNPGVDGYVVGTQRDPDYQVALRNLGFSRAPTGVIEYQSNTFNGRLQNRILFTEYSSGDDIVVLEVDPNNGSITGSSILAGGSVNPDWGMADPVDLIEDTSNGFLYVAELNVNTFTGRIRLVRPNV